MKVFYPDKTKLQKFLGPPIIFAIISCAIVLLSVGFHVGALLTSLGIILVVCSPFFLFILPTFLFEKIIIEDFTSTLFFAFFFIKFKRVVYLENIISITERYRNEQKGKQREIVIKTNKEELTISEIKYTQNDIKEIINTYKKKNPLIKVTLLK